MFLSIDLKNSVHVFLAHKGGAGKTTAASLFAEWLIQQKELPIVFDADVKNQTSCISQYKALNARRLSDQLLKTEHDGNEVITSVGFASLLDSMFDEEGPHLVDVGANAYVQFLSFMDEMDAVAALKDAGKDLYVHAIVAGGEMTLECANGAQEIAKRMPDAKMILWINQPNAEARMPSGVLYKESAEFEKISASLTGVVVMNKMSDVMQNAHAALAPLHLLSSQIEVDSSPGSRMRSLSYKSWARQAFSALDSVFQKN